MTSAAPIVIVAFDDAERAHALAAHLHLPLFQTGAALPDSCVAFLAYRDNRLQLFPADAKQSGPVCVDFAGNAALHRLQSGGELIVKAVKGRSKNALTVLDATAGLGRDGFILAAHGFSVTLLERNPIIATLLEDGLQRAAPSEIAEIAARLHLVRSDAREYLANLSAEDRPDVIYLDPMFAHKEKSALVKKEMRLFRQLLEDERHSDKDTIDSSSDENALFAVALAAAKLRVVVKRALKAKPLADREPAYRIAGKAIRYDVYPA